MHINAINPAALGGIKKTLFRFHLEHHRYE